jgi:bifunctional UDP-N-acetylglucosamine pyrophosphorylase / glucosamine-1-phosphate N-acetyltransferase
MTKIIILAAGKGTRMGMDIPKVLAPLNNRPIIKYLLDTVEDSKIDNRPIIVVSPDGEELIKKELDDYNLEYILQKEQLGTGHAVLITEDFLDQEIDKIVVLYGDHPFIKSQSITKLLSLDFSALAIMPTSLSDFNDWRQNFYHWGRIIRNSNQEIEKIIEFKDANDKEKQVLEVNPGIMAFKKDWLFANLKRLNNDNKQKEYYLTDLVKLAFKEGLKIEAVNIQAEEAIGVNSQAELEIAAKLLK